MDVCRILIVEDESIVAMDMADMLQQLGYEVLPTAMNYQEALKCLEEKLPDIVLVDITLGGAKSGIDLATIINENYHLPFIFITSHSDNKTVSLASATKPNGYLVKPFDSADLFTSIEVALANYVSKSVTMLSNGYEHRIDDSVFIRTDKCFTKIRIQDINWLESAHNYLYIITDNQRYVIRSSFKDFLQSVHSEVFLQVHKSFVINQDKIDSFTHSGIIINSKTIPLSRSYKDEFFSKMNKVM